MRFDILTLFPEMTDGIFSYSIIARAAAKGLIELHSHNIRDYSTDKHRKVDDIPYVASAYFQLPQGGKGRQR